MNKLNICGVEYKLIWEPSIIVYQGQEMWAQLTSEDRTIRIFDGLSELDAKRCLLHEVFHEILNSISDLNIDNSEVFVKVFSRLVFDTIVRNDLFTRKVKGS